MINWMIHMSWMVLPCKKSLGGQPDTWHHHKQYFIFHCTKQTDSMLPSICSTVDHRRCQNVVKTSVTLLALQTNWFEMKIYNLQNELIIWKLQNAMYNLQNENLFSENGNL